MLQAADRLDQQRQAFRGVAQELGLHRQADEAEAGAVEIGDGRIAQIGSQRGRIGAGGETEPAGDVDAALQDLQALGRRFSAGGDGTKEQDEQQDFFLPRGVGEGDPARSAGG